MGLETSRAMALWPDADVLEVTDGVLAACGGGRSLHAGIGADASARLFRRRALHAVVLPADAAELSRELADRPDRDVDLVCLYGVLDGLERHDRVALFDHCLRVAARGVLVVTGTRTREAWERELLQRPCRKHPLSQFIVPYDGLDHRQGAAILLFEPFDAGLTIGRSVDGLLAGRDLHMDMLREGGRRADAHVARYMLARQFVRPGDRVLDAACGLGYGAAILTDGTLADSVTGLDIDASAIRYANDHYARPRARLSFAACDVARLSHIPDASFDIVVSFETIEHVADPDGFVAACRRLLTPAGRLICSVPNAWVDETGRDPNPHHLQVFDRARIEDLCRAHFLVEGVYGQTAGGGMKLPNASRALWKADDDPRDAEWWLVAAMVPPAVTSAAPFRTGLSDDPESDLTNVLAFARDYRNPWLAKALVTIGLRPESSAVLAALADDTLVRESDASGHPTADEGAALCVKAYRAIEADRPMDDALHAAIDRYCGVWSAVAHVRRWQTSLRYAEAMCWIRQARWDRAIPALEACASADALAFSPHLATKTVGAAVLRGWIAAQSGDADTARRWWTSGIAQTERALGHPWDDLLVSRRSPPLFGLREATLIVDLASRCAAGLHLLPHLGDRPGLVLSQFFESAVERGARDAERVRSLERQLQDAVRENDELRAHARAAALLRSGRSLPTGVRIAVFGAGSGGQRALRSLRARGGDVACLTDNDRARHGSIIDGVPVVDPASLPTRGIDIVAVASLPGRSAIFAQLAQMGYEIGRDVAFVDQ